MQTKHAHNVENFNSTKRINLWDESGRSTNYVTRVRLDVSCSSYSLSNLLAWHPSQLFAIFPCSIRSSPADVKQNSRNFAGSLHNMSCKNLGLLGRSLLTKLAIIHAVAIRMVTCIIYVTYCFHSYLRRVSVLELYVLKKSCFPDFVPGRRERFGDVVVFACTKSTSWLTRYLFISFFRLSIVVVSCCWYVHN